MKNKNIIQIGVIGIANIAVRSVIPAILELPEYYRLAGVASRSIGKADHYAHTFGTSAYHGYQDLLDAPDIQAIYIPLPNALHTEWIQKSLGKGLHVLVEKSMACRLEDVVRVNQIAREKKLALIENFQFRFHSQLAFIKDLVSNGTIGDLRCLRSSFGFPGLPDENDIRYQKTLGGGALLDTGAYPLKIAQIFLGAAIMVKAANLNFLQGKEVDIWGGAYVKQKRGPLFGELAFGFNHHYQCSLELWGSKGKIFTNRIFTAHKDHEPVIELETRAGKEIITLPADHHFRNMLQYFYEIIVDGKNREAEYQKNMNQARLIKELQQEATNE